MGAQADMSRSHLKPLETGRPARDRPTWGWGRGGEGASGDLLAELARLVPRAAPPPTPVLTRISRRRRRLDWARFISVSQPKRN